MVGVPNSKGCALCLKRSVKCDEARPRCSQCRRGGRTCPGYAPREMKFVDEGRRLQPSSQKVKASKPGITSVKGPKSLFSVSATTNDCALNGARDDDRHSVHNYHNRRREDTILYQLTSSSLERGQVLSSFVSAMFPLGIASVQMSFLGSWLWHVPPRMGYNTVLDYAAQSLAFAYFARVSRDQVVLRKAELSYNLALRGLATAISNRSREFSSELVCATLLLGNYETFVNVNHTAIRHAGGAARLMQLRGAARCYESPFEYSMFLACRGAIIYEALETGEPCFLDAKDWRSIPDGLIEFPLLPKRPELLHTIFGCFAAIPGLMNKVKRVTKGTTHSVRHSILSSAYKLREDLRQWYCQYILSDNGMESPILAKVSPIFANDSPFNSTFVYRDVLSGSMITTYYAYLILINNAIDSLQTDSSYSSETFELAQAICMSVDYCSHAGYCGTQTMRFSLPIAHNVMPARYHEWTQAWMRKFSGILEASMIQASHT